MELDYSRLKEILRRFQDQPVLVVGDLILDEFVWGRVRRISPEAPVPVIEVHRQSSRLGGAANVAANLAVMGARPVVIGVIGADTEGERLCSELRSAGIGTDGVAVDSGRPTSVKTRIIAHHQQVCRTDRESREALSPRERTRILDRFRRSLKECGAVILSDYAKGVLSKDLAPDLISEARTAGKFVAVDPKVQHLSIYRTASIVTPNQQEAEEASGVAITDRSTLTESGRLLLRRLSSDYLLITRGDEGMSLFDKDRQLDIPTVAREVFDVTGAGDTVIATLTLAVAAGATVHEAALIANLAAGIVVGKLGTAAARVDEILASSHQPDARGSA